LTSCVVWGFLWHFTELMKDDGEEEKVVLAISFDGGVVWARKERKGEMKGGN